MLNTPEIAPPSGMDSALKTHAVVFSEPERLSVRALDLPQPGPSDLLVDIEWTGISTGTERLLFDGTMPPFPGLAYPLVPGYESVGRVVAAGADTGFEVDQRVFVSGANCYGEEVRGLFGGAASRLVVPAEKASPLAGHIGAEGVLLALAATAHHAICKATRAPELIVGHGVLGRLLARLVVALGNDAPVVWEISDTRRNGAAGYRCIAPGDDERRDYLSVCDVSGDAAIIDRIVPSLSRGGEIVLAGFYGRVGFDFPAMFMREAAIRIAAEWQPADLTAVSRLVHTGELSLDGLITHRAPAAAAAEAYRTAFGDAGCLKMILDWSELA